MAEANHEQKHEHECCGHDHDQDDFSDEEDVEYEFDQNVLDQMREQIPDEIKKLPLPEQDEYITRVLNEFAARQKKQHKMAKIRPEYKKFIEENYKMKNSELLKLKESYFVPSFWNAIFPDPEIRNDPAKYEKNIRNILSEVHNGIYAFDMLSKEYCELLLDELTHFETWCQQNQTDVFRPNTMNNYGAILDDFGFENVMQEWVDKLVTPMAKILYPLFVGKGLDSHHAFVVEYKVGKDEKLDFHVDDSEVTLNVCLGRIFTGGTLFFRGIRCAQHQQTEPQENELFDFGHLQGRGILHVGRHRHGANKIKSGERFNLILWCRSSSFRESEYLTGHFPMCGVKE